MNGRTGSGVRSYGHTRCVFFYSTPPESQSAVASAAVYNPRLLTPRATGAVLPGPWWRMCPPPPPPTLLQQLLHGHGMMLVGVRGRGGGAADAPMFWKGLRWVLLRRSFCSNSSMARCSKKARVRRSKGGAQTPSPLPIPLPTQFRVNSS